VAELLRESAAAEYAPSDGGGRAWLVRDPGQPESTLRATPDRFRLFYEVGPEGIASGGVIHFQVSPFWGWSTPQVQAPDGLGYTEVRAEPDDIVFRAETLDEQLLGIVVTGRPLVEGDRFEIVYGAGSAGALTDSYAERDSRFWFAVDGDGDGTRLFLPDSPGIEVLPSEAAQLLVTLPSVARPGETIRITLAALDSHRNTGVPFEAEVVFVDPPDGIELPAAARFAPEDDGRLTLSAVVRTAGVYRLAVQAGALQAESNPLLVSAEGPRVLWGDLHGHSNFSDGTGVPEDYFRYARDASALDVVALTDHDHWGVLPLVRYPELWREIREQTRRFHEPGRFVALLGFEWTSWIHGHRHVLYFEDDGPLIDSVAAETDSPLELWSALEGHDALTFAHHSAGGPVGTNWEIPPDPRFEPLTEIVSVHGSSEALDSPDPIYNPIEGNFARDALDRGYRLGFLGSGDGHDGHPGIFEDRYRGGLAAILSDEHTRAGVLGALRSRRVYATNGARMLLRMAVGSVGMGGVVTLAPGERKDETLFVQVMGTAPLDRVEVVRSGVLLDGLALEGVLDTTVQADLEGLEAGEYIYVRVLQRDGGAGWSSPVFFGER
jgi:hypothetical protein